MAHTWSDYQIPIFDAVKKTQSNIVIEALSGSAKTTTLIQAIKGISPTKRVLFTAFNKHIADELQQKVPSYVQAKTLHSLGFSSIASYYGGNIEVSEYKSLGFIDKVIHEWKISPKKREGYRFAIFKAIDLIRLNMISTDKDIQNLLDYHDINISLISSNYIKHINQVLQLLNVYDRTYKPTNSTKKKISFCDMLYYPAAFDHIVTKKYDVILVDEFQDTNNCQLAFIDKMVARNGRLIVSGDKNQCIYQFIGGDKSLFEKVKAKQNTISLPLPICYRCSKAVIKEAQKIVSSIEPFESNQEGKVLVNGSIDDVTTESTAILCRNNKPLVVAYLELLTKKIKASIRNKDLETSLIKLLDTLGRDSNSEEALSMLREQYFSLIEHYSERGVKKPEKHPKVVTFKENANIVKVLLDRFKTVRDVRLSLTKMFDHDTKGVFLMTTHGSKGLEWDNVFLIRPDLLTSPSEHNQEYTEELNRNLLYIAITRARQNFTYIPKLKWDDAEIAKEFEF